MYEEIHTTQIAKVDKHYYHVINHTHTHMHTSCMGTLYTTITRHMQQHLIGGNLPLRTFTFLDDIMQRYTLYVNRE